ncbi:MAG: hypothetical protein HY369_02345 [Candidatus Aenigmarchaeota archaeon]|nr:hypothetical protein [Candidatus Aenigmarchaeota archaeon]
MVDWKKARGEAFTQAAEMEKLIPGYSYETPETCQRTDERVCQFLNGGLSAAKKLLYNVSDLLFSLQLAEGLLDKFQDAREEVDVLGDEVKVHHCTWKPIPHEFLVRLIRHDASLAQRVHRLNLTVEILFNGILAETKKGRQRKSLPVGFWRQVEDALREVRQETREIGILFRERHAIASITPLHLERSYEDIVQGIRRSG